MIGSAPAPAGLPAPAAPLFRIEMPGALESASNLRESRWDRMARVKRQRRAAWALVREQLGRGKPTFPLLVTLTRIAPRALDAHDNLRAAFKAIVDGVADALGTNDRDPRVVWKYDQERGAVREYGIRIEIEEKGVSE